jgi:DNA invertase Pin-like site-specific DNA recombinase
MPKGKYPRQPWMGSAPHLRLYPTILRLRAEGIAYRAIARALQISPQTVQRVLRGGDGDGTERQNISTTAAA